MFEKIAEEQGWNDATKICILLEYIDNQGSPEAFDDFISEKQDAENYSTDFDQPDEAQEWHDFDPDC